MSHGERQKTLVVQSRRLLPVEEVVPGHHAQEAGWISDRVELVVELFKLLVQQISCLALSLAARTPSGRRTGRDTEGMGGKNECKIDFSSSTTDYSGAHVHDLSQTHIDPHTHTHGLILQAWSNPLSQRLSF